MNEKWSMCFHVRYLLFIMSGGCHPDQAAEKKKGEWCAAAWLKPCYGCESTF